MGRKRISASIPEELLEQLEKVQHDLADKNHAEFSRSRTVEMALNMLVKSQKESKEQDKQSSED